MTKAAIIVIPLLMLGCGHEPAAPRLAASHSVVLRTEDTLFHWESLYEAQDLIVRHFKADDLSLCGGATPFPVLEIQWVYAPSATQRRAVNDELPVFVYSLSDVPPPADWQNLSPGFCAALANNWVYRGTTRFLQQDNDFDLGGVRTNAITRILTGTVSDRDGQAHSYRESCVSNDRPGSAEPPGPLGHYWDRCELSIR